MLLTPIASTSLESAVSTPHAEIAAGMVAGTYYAFASTTACWVATGATPVATAGAGNMLVPANTIIYLDGSDGPAISVLRDAADGKCSLTRCRKF